MAKRPLTLLVSSAGRRVGLIECFRRSAADLGIQLHVTACDAAPDLSAACQAADSSFRVPPCHHPEFIETVADAARRREIRLIVPTIDPELRPYALAAAEFNRSGTRVHVSDTAVIDVARDKLETMRVLGDAGVPTPRTARLDDVRKSPRDWVGLLLLKPRGGSASRLVSVVERPEDLPESESEPMIVQEYLDGPEFTVNMFIDRHGALKCVVPHRRLQIRAGEVEKGRTERHPALADIAGRIARALPEARGALCFQVIDDTIRGPEVIELNARFGGGYPLAHHAGAPFCQWLLEEVSDVPGTAHDDWREGVLMLRYDAAVFQG
ncbi:MAG: ATP-grasp domain-containing protein [Rhizobium sp.]|nr:ATP-grasp domain-containing protein [Rhizobium sp.]